jgi:uncharacterized Fe-S cluster protein YjdI/CDGSH-type Zn-finger protein
MAEPTSMRKRYTGEAVDVTFDPLRCRHAAECLRGLPAVFDRDRRPWILPDAGDSADVVRVVARCPTGALRTHPHKSAAGEQPAMPTEIVALPGGPVLVRGDLHVTSKDGLDADETRAALCSCGSTANPPYCDGSGTCVDWPRSRRPDSEPV